MSQQNCGPVDLWTCGTVDLWTCGTLDLWTCGLVDLRPCGLVNLWTCVDWLTGFQAQVGQAQLPIIDGGQFSRVLLSHLAYYIIPANVLSQGNAGCGFQQLTP